MRVVSDAAAAPNRHARDMTQSTLTAILPTLMVGWLMVMAGLGKKRLDFRPRACPSCGRRRCACAGRH
jgi:hypothetical protein